MRATSTILSAAGALVLLAIASSASAADAKADPKTVFTSNKCNSCHAVAKQGIAVVEEPGEAADDEGDDAGPKPPDLSGVGAVHDAKWIKDWLLKKVDIEGRKHRKKFEGKPADLDVLATWLAGLKDAGTPAK